MRDLKNKLSAVHALIELETSTVIALINLSRKKSGQCKKFIK